MRFMLLSMLSGCTMAYNLGPAEDASVGSDAEPDDAVVAIGPGIAVESAEDPDSDVAETDSEDSDTDPDGDTDSGDGDSDDDTDSGDGDSDTDTDSDTDSGGDSDSGGDTDIDGDTDSDSDTDIVDPCACPEGYDPSETGDSCERSVTETATWDSATYDVVQGAQHYVYGEYGALYPGGSNERSDYWGDTDTDITEVDGRLNTIGIWAADPTTGLLGEAPLDEWLHLTTCIEAGAGDYILGIAGDNQTELYIDGELIYEEHSGVNKVFKYWNLFVVDLDEGPHVVDLYGRNDGSIASIGQELSGPFPAGTLVDDAAMQAVDYDAALVDGTSDHIGEQWGVGSTSALTCPDGATLDSCAHTCETIEVVACE